MHSVVYGMGGSFLTPRNQKGDETMRVLCDVIVLGAAAWVAYWTYLEALL